MRHSGVCLLNKRALLALLPMAWALLSGCGADKPPDEAQIAADLISENYDISQPWIQSREHADDVGNFIPYEITSVTIEKRDTQEETGWDSVWFDFEATNGIHNYTGSACADYKLYSQGGWIFENCTVESYLSSPACEPRFEEFAAVMDNIAVRDFPASLSQSDFSLEECYLNADDVPQSNIDSAVFPYGCPVAVFRYTGKAGPADDFYTQSENPYYILGYQADSNDAFSAGWYYYTIGYASDSTQPQPKSEWRLYKSESESDYDDCVLIALRLEEAAITQVDIAYPVNGKFYTVYEDDSPHTDIPADDPLAIRMYGEAQTDHIDPEWGQPAPEPYSFTASGSYLTLDNLLNGPDPYQTAELVETCPLEQTPSMRSWIEKYADDASSISDAVT